MANSLTNLIPTLRLGMEEVSREMVGFIPSVTRNVSAERAAVNETIQIDIPQALTAVDVVPAMDVPEPEDFGTDKIEMKITKSRAVPFGLTGEEERGVNNGRGIDEVLKANFKQAVRVLTNEIEKDLAVDAAAHCSLAYGTSGTTPFASDLSDAAEVAKLLDDNLAPKTGRSLIMGTDVTCNLRKLTQLTDVDRSGTDMTLRYGEILDLFSISFKQSQFIQSPDVGTAESVTIKAAAVGATELTMTAGSGTILPGDFISVAGSDAKYGVVSVGAIGSGVIKIAAPGLVAPAAETAAVTVVAKGKRNIAFTSNAIQLIARAPALPSTKDLAIDSYMLTDPFSGMTYEVRVYPGYRKVRMEVACAWGTKVIRPEQVVALLG